VWFCLLLGLVFAGLSLPLDGWAPLVHLLGQGAPPSVLLGATVAIGSCTHIAGDGCTDFGISPFAPVLKLGGRRFPRLALLPEPFRFKVSKFVEDKIVSPICGVLAVLCAMATFVGPERVVGAIAGLGEGLWRVFA
jgi:hypothetical protein